MNCNVNPQPQTISCGLKNNSKLSVITHSQTNLIIIGVHIKALFKALSCLHISTLKGVGVNESVIENVICPPLMLK